MLRDWLDRCRAWLGLEADPLAGQDRLGMRGEKAAARFLKGRGYKIVARGVRSRLGELDLVAVQDRTVVFVEVKTRAGTDAGQPLDAVTPEKQRRLTQAALAFLKYRGLLEERSRFDVVSVVWPVDAREPQIEHIVNAFEAVGRGQMWR
jgi:putative endonuclease